MQNKQWLHIISTVFITLAFIALLLGQKEELKSSDALLSIDDFDETIKSHVMIIDALELAKYIKEQPNFYWLIDLRDSTLFNDYHIPTSVNLNMDQLFKNNLKINNKIFLIDSYEAKSLQAYFLLNIRGYFDVKVIEGGIDAWQDKVLFPDRNNIPKSELERRLELTNFFGGQIIIDSSSEKKIMAPKKIEKVHSTQIGC